MFDIILGRSKGDVEKYGKKGAVMIGKQYVQMGQTSSLSNPIYMDVSRAHAFLIVGKRGCLTQESMIYTNKGFKKIIEFNEKKDKILSFNKENLNYEWEEAKFIEISEDEQLYNIKFEDGQELNLTSEHPLLIFRNKIVQWQIASEIKITDKIASSYSLPKTNLENKESLRIARLLGFILADGTLYEKIAERIDSKGYKYNGRRCRIRIINAEETILQQAKRDFDEEFNINSRIYKKGKENCYIVETQQQKIFDKFVKFYPYFN